MFAELRNLLIGNFADWLVLILASPSVYDELKDYYTSDDQKYPTPKGSHWVPCYKDIPAILCDGLTERQVVGVSRDSLKSLLSSAKESQ